MCECFELLVVRPEANWDKTEADPLFRLLYCDGVDRSWRELPIEGDMSVKLPQILVPKIHLWSTRNSSPVPKGSWPVVAAECFVTFVVDCEASEQWKTVSDWTAQPLMESTMTIEQSVTRRAEVTPEGRKQRKTGCLRRDCRHTVTPQRLSEKRTRLPQQDVKEDASTSGVAETSGMRCSAGLCRDTKPKSP